MKSKFRVEHYRVEAFSEPLKIIQDQRQEARKFVVLAPLLMVIAYAFGPLGGMRINGEHLDWFFFSAVELGLMVSMGVVIYATGYTPPPAFNWTLVLAFSDDKTVQLVSSTRKTMDALIRVLRTRFKLEITEQTEWTSGTKALAKVLEKTKKHFGDKNY